MSANNTKYSAEEDQIIRDMYAEGWSDAHIAAALVKASGVNRTRLGVQSRRCDQLRLVRKVRGATSAYGPRPVTSEEGDTAFQKALLRAARTGSENVTPGTFVDNRPSFARTYCPEPMMSGCGSSAALAAEMGAHSGID